MSKRRGCFALLLVALLIELFMLIGFQRSLRAGELSWRELEVPEEQVTLALIASARMAPRLSRNVDLGGLETVEDYGLEGLLFLLMCWVLISALVVAALSFRVHRVSKERFALRLLMACAFAGAPLALSNVFSTLKALSLHKPSARLIRCFHPTHGGQPQFQLGAQKLTARTVMDRLKSGEKLRFLDRQGNRVPLITGFSKSGNEIFGAKSAVPWKVGDLDLAPCGP